jgi:hypothetical protein
MPLRGAHAFRVARRCAFNIAAALFAVGVTVYRVIRACAQHLSDQLEK